MSSHTHASEIRLMQLLGCPEDHSALRLHENVLVCRDGHTFQFEQGIPIFAKTPRREVIPGNMGPCEYQRNGSAQPAPPATPGSHPRRGRFQSRTREEETSAATQPVCLTLTIVPKSRVRPRVGHYHHEVNYLEIGILSGRQHLIHEHVCVLGLMPGLRNGGQRESPICSHGMIAFGQSRWRHRPDAKENYRSSTLLALTRDIKLWRD
jgi:uncharacterized protein YbaR (Trm112 family)